MASIWSAAAGTPTGTHRVPVDTGAAGSPTMYTVQQLADLETSVGVSVNALGSIGTNTSVDLSLGGYVSATITGNLTLSFTNPPAGGTEFTLVLTNGGAFTVTWPGSVTWAGATAPTLTASGTDVLHFTSGNGGTNWYGWLEADLALGTTAGTAAEGNDSRLSDDRTASGIRETSGPTLLVVGAIADGEYIKRVGSTAVGGTPSGLTGFTAAENTSAPNATVPVASLTANNAATNVDAALVPKGSGGVAADVADSTTTGGNKRGTKAVDWQRSRFAATNVASGTLSVIAGGEGNTASGIRSAVGGGSTNAASGERSVIAGGYQNTASGYGSWVSGGQTATTRGVASAGAYAMSQRAAVGDRQTMVLPIACAARTDATATVMTSDAGAASTTNQMVLPNNASMFFEVDVVAHDSSLKSASWKVQGTIRRGANAAATAIVGTNVTTTFGSDLSGGSPGVTCTADTTNGALKVTFTGIAATTIYPSGHIRTVIAA